MFARMTAMRRHGKAAVWWGIAGTLIVFGLWSMPARSVPANGYDEPIWLAHSLCFDAIVTGRYRESCREVNVQALDQSAGAKYLFAGIRWLGGIPPEAVKYYYHLDDSTPLTQSLDPTIRETVVRFLTALSSITLLILFSALRRSFGYGPALVTLALLVVAPYWQFTLRSIMAEPALCFFSILALATTLRLASLMMALPQRSLPSLVCAAACAGLSIGMAIGVKANAATVALAFAAVMVYVGISTRKQWFLVVWLSAFAGLIVVLCFAATNPFIWSHDFVERIRMFGVFRAVLSFQTTGASPLSPPESLRVTFTRSFESPLYSILPAALSIPFCLVGLWRAASQRNALARVGGLWLVVAGLSNALVVYIDPYPYVTWGRYVLYTLLAINFFIGNGIWACVQAAREVCWPLPIFRRAPAPQPGMTQTIARRYGMGSKVIGTLCILCAIVPMVGGGVISRQTATERTLWDALDRSSRGDQQLDILNQLVEAKPDARMWALPGNRLPDRIGIPLIEILAEEFQTYQYSVDPGILHAMATTGRLLEQYGSPETRMRARYDMGHLGQAWDERETGSVEVAPFENDAPPAWTPKDWKEDPRELLLSNQTSIRTTVRVQRAGSYRLIAPGLNAVPAPIRVGVMVDERPVGTLVYDKGDDSWTPQSVVAFLDRGPHRVQFQLQNDYTDIGRSLDRNGAIRELIVVPADDSRVCAIDGSISTSVRAELCASTDRAVVLTDASPNAIVGISAPVSALYDITLNIRSSGMGSQQAVVTVDGNRLGGTLGLAGSAASVSSTIGLPPIYLVQGMHAITVTRFADANVTGEATITLDETSLTPRYPDMQTLTPAAFGTGEPRASVMVGTAPIVARMKWYGYGYGFYGIHITGSADHPSAPLEVSIDGQMIGTTTLSRDGSPVLPLTVELANGATHTIALRASTPSQGAKAMVYAVEIRPFTGPQIFPGTSMRWAKKDNGAMHSDGGIIHLAPNVRVTRSISVGAPAVYTITAHIHLPKSGPGTASLRLIVDGWDSGEQIITATPDWADQAFTAYLPASTHDIQFYWRDDAGMDPLDIAFFTIQQRGVPPPS